MRWWKRTTVVARRRRNRPAVRLALVGSLLAAAPAAAEPPGRTELHANPFGQLGVHSPAGPADPRDHPFFRPLGDNGRACATCHRPEAGFALSLRDVRARFAATGGTDPLFAPADAADCPGGATYARILNHGTIRVELAWPPRTRAGAPIEPEFELAVADACATDPDRRVVSVYRRPPPAAQMNFKTLRADGAGPVLAGSLMWDGRFSSLEDQAADAARGHAQMRHALSAAQVAAIVALQTGTFAAQLVDAEAGRLDRDGGRGGPANLAGEIPLPAGGVTFAAYDGWRAAGGKRASIARGQALFNARRFAARDVDGFNDAPGVGNPSESTSCSTCHNIAGSGADVFADPQRNIGIGGTAAAAGGPSPSPDLPRFTLTCHAGAKPGFQGFGPMVTNDPGRALVTGRCADIGRFTVPQLRGLAGREPYFHDGSAGPLAEVVRFYDRRFAIGLTAEERQDLVNFLAAL